MAYNETADVNERERDKLRKDIKEELMQKADLRTNQYNNLNRCDAGTMGAAMEPTLVNNLTEEINGLRRRLEKLETLRNILSDSPVRNLHGAINIF